MTAYRVEPWLDDGDLCLYHGDVLHVLRELPSGIAQTCVTSPPYWGLRDYQTGTWSGGDPDCDHLGAPFRTKSSLNENWGAGYSDVKNAEDREPMGQTCSKCGARRVDDQLGLEATPTEYVAKMVAVFREVRRILRDDGTLWLNIGDSYAGSASQGGPSEKQQSNVGSFHEVPRSMPPGLKPKDLVGIPWRLAFALQTDGWYLRSDIIWAKPNPMPESVTDRPTKSHEYVFLFSKRPRYFYDADAVREPSQPWNSHEGFGGNGKKGEGDPLLRTRGYGTQHADETQHGRNLRSVWQIATQPYPEAHFATYPEELVRRCILAGTSERGGCAECGAPWRRTIERGELVGTNRGGNYNGRQDMVRAAKPSGTRLGFNPGTPGMRYENETVGWEPTCRCSVEYHSEGCPSDDGVNPSEGRKRWGPASQSEPVPQLVLDPFIGSGTTALVARKHGRHSIGIDLSRDYLELAARRTRQLSLLGGC